MLHTVLHTVQRPDAGLGLMAPTSVFHCELFEETVTASVSPLRAQTYSVKLFISLPAGVICQQHSAIQKKKRRGEVVYCNGNVEGEEPWSGIGQHHSLGGTFSIICHTDAHTHTPMESKSVSPHRWNCFQWKGREKMLHSVHSMAKIKLSQEMACVVLPSTLRWSGEMLSHRGVW